MRLETMTPAAFARYFETSTAAFAQGSPRLRHLPPPQALELARDEFNSLLPAGLGTPHHLLWSIFDEDACVGFLHLGPQDGAPLELFAWDFEIFAPFRKRGLGTKAVQLAMARVKHLGYKRVHLNVFGENEIAMAMYRAAGFAITQVQMEKGL